MFLNVHECILMLKMITDGKLQYIKKGKKDKKKGTLNKQQPVDDEIELQLHQVYNKYIHCSQI